MFETYPLIATIVVSVVFASLLGFLANRLHLPTILGYLLAGIMLGPHTPGFIADINIAKQLAEIGVILLMFGVGLHFSTKDLVIVHRIALPGALIQIVITSTLCLGVAMLMKHSFLESMVFGLTLSVASTVVLLRAFEQYKMINSHVAKIAIGWLIAEDVIMIVVLVLLPVFADMMHKGDALNLRDILEIIFLTLLKITAFIMVMLVIGKKLLPKLLIGIAKTKSRELMSLGILAIASGFAFIAYTLFGTSFALGAFMAGLILNESKIGQKSAEKSLPLRDLFAVLFFISAGMLFDPAVLTREPLLVLIALILVVLGKAFVAYAIMRFFRQGFYNSLILAVSLAQIGEFSFIVTALALKLGIFSQILYDMVIASALISITINPFLFKLAEKFKPTKSRS
jgi:CPA2 family monovalent cation:H+ antiporter-2